MNNKKIPPKKTVCTKNRFSNTLLATQLLIMASVLNAYFLSAKLMAQGQTPDLLSLRLGALLLAVSTLFIMPLLKIIGKRNLQKATTWYFWLISIFTATMAFLEGGLYSLPVMCFPVIAIFSAQHTHRKVFLSICAFFSLMVILMTINHELGWFQGVVTSGSARMFECLILVFASAYVAWELRSYNKWSISTLKKEHQQVVESKKLIQHLADTDPLTALANRALAKARFEEMQSELDLDNEEIGLYFVDLDNFKTVNDLFDHNIGDELLKIIAKRLSRLIDNKGVVCRLGGDEFVLFIKASKPFEYDQLAKEILISLSEPHVIFGIQAEITASIGISVINNRDISFDNARKQADIAMYKAKQSGKNDYHYFSEKLQRDYMKNLTILNELKDALSRNLFDLHFQPKVDIETNQVIGAEALLRWTRENANNLTPGYFIPVIESTELIHSIGEWVVAQSCIACKHWHQQGHEISIAVNVSALQLSRVGFYDVVVNALNTSGLQAKFLEIELTEHFLIQENPTIMSQLSDLKKLGVKLAIDDFGTGYSNMGYLTSMEVDTLKLDRSFITEIDKSPDSLAIVTAINQMADVLGMNVVAEGVERESERKILETLGCDIGQGFLWSKALPSSVLLEYLTPKESALNQA